MNQLLSFLGTGTLVHLLENYKITIRIENTTDKTFQSIRIPGVIIWIGCILSYSCISRLVRPIIDEIVRINKQVNKEIREQEREIERMERQHYFGEWDYDW